MTRALLLAPVLGVLFAGYVPHVQNAGFVYEDRSVVNAPTTRRPLTAWTWQFTETPQAAHAMSLGLLLALSVGVGALAWRLGLSQLASVAAGALVVVHPLTVEATAYAASRYELMAALGIVGACVAVTWSSPYRWPLVALSLVCGLASKETAIVGLVLVPLTAWAARTRTTQQTWAWYGLGAVMAILAALQWVDPGADGWRWFINLGEGEGVQVNAGDWLLGQATATVRLLGVALTGLGMTIDADIDAAKHAGYVALCFGLTLSPALFWRTRPLIAFGLAWAVLSLLPRFIIQTPRSYLNDHHFLVPFIGLVLASASLVEKRSANADSGP